jgi:hypothetical protein
MFKGRTDEVVARMPAPESDPGSGIARNEPQGEPGAHGPDLSIHIANP